MAAPRAPDGIYAYAQHRGIALSQVQKAIRLKRIELEPDGSIDFAKADLAWEANKRPTVAPEELLPDLEQAAIGPEHYTKARAQREYYNARMAKIEYEKALGSLVSREEMENTAFEKYRAIRDRLLAVPDRIAALVAAESDTTKCHEMISAEIRRALNDSTEPVALDAGGV